MDIILLFINKLAWYDSWCKTFPAVSKYPEMVKWLKSEGEKGKVKGKGKEKEKVSHKAGSSKAGRK